MPFLHARDFPNSDDPNIKATNFYTRNTNAFSLCYMQHTVIQYVSSFDTIGHLNISRISLSH